MGPKFMGQSGNGGCLEEIRAQVHRVPGEGSGIPRAPHWQQQMAHPPTPNPAISPLQVRAEQSPCLLWQFPPSLPCGSVPRRSLPAGGQRGTQWQADVALGSLQPGCCAGMCLCRGRG